MEEPWAQRVRSLANKQAEAIVDASLDGYRLTLKRRDNKLIDAGLIKQKPPGILAYMAKGGSGSNDEPDIYVSKDGVVWSPAASEGKFSSGVQSSNVDGGCWTGDRFIVGVYADPSGYTSALLQSRDGGTWTYHPDLQTFSLSADIRAMAATKSGLVVVVGLWFGTDLVNGSSMAISRDFGETWEVIPFNIDFPFAGEVLYSVAVKNEFEWCVAGDGGPVWYTYDGGAHWNEVILPGEFTIHTYWGSGMRYFKEHWWFFGYGVGSGVWDTPLIKSKDLSLWEPVVTPWSGTYSLFEEVYGSPHDNGSGEIFCLEYDHATNVVIASGDNLITDSMVMISPDGGDHWFEIGYVHDDHFRVDDDWDGIYNWPDNWSFVPTGGMRAGYGWLFVVNVWSSPDGNTPPLIRISPDGKISEPIYPAGQSFNYGYHLFSGGDTT